MGSNRTFEDFNGEGTHQSKPDPTERQFANFAAHPFFKAPIVTWSDEAKHGAYVPGFAVRLSMM